MIQRNLPEPTWVSRRVTIVLSDCYHTLHLVNLMAPVQLLKPNEDDLLPTIRAPINAITEKARANNPGIFKGCDVVGILCSAWDMLNKGTIVWVTPSEKIEETELGADRV